MTTPFSALASANAKPDLPLAVGPAMRASGGFGLAIATLIAAGRLDDRLLGEVLARLGDAQFSAWIDEGEAADVTFCADLRAAHVSLSEIEGLDFAIREGPRVPAKLFVADMDSTMIGQECIDEL